jgi:hypothetical protein
MSYLFFLGRSIELGSVELLTFFPNCTSLEDSIYRVDEDTILVNGKTLPIQEAIHVLGGIVKIAETIDTIPHMDPFPFVRYLVKELENNITFGISTYEKVGKISQSLYQDIKKLLEQEGKKVRFVLPKEGNTLGSVVVEKQGVIELNVIATAEGLLLSRTIAVQEFESWASRDYDRPYFDSKKGMLPPKAARMIVNIGLGRDAAGKTLLDPFCGMGTIPGEAILRGAIAMGADNAHDAVEKAKKNTIWLRSRDSSLPPVTYFVSDATHISEFVREETIDAIVTEPFMGSPKMGLGKVTDSKEIKNAIKGLEKLYIGCLREWHALLKPHGSIVMALPEITHGNTKYFVKNIIDSCETLGYTTDCGPLPYSRPQAVVRRMFYKFIKK